MRCTVSEGGTELEKVRVGGFDCTGLNERLDGEIGRWIGYLVLNSFVTPHGG